MIMEQHLFDSVAVARVVFIQDFEVDPGQSLYNWMVLAKLGLWNIERNKGTTFNNQLICVDTYDVKHEKQTNMEESVLGLHCSRLQISCWRNESRMKWHIAVETKWAQFADDVSKCISFSKKFGSVIKISLKLISTSQINNKPSLVQIMLWRRTGDKPLFESMMV